MSPNGSDDAMGTCFQVPRALSSLFLEAAPRAFGGLWIVSVVFASWLHTNTPARPDSVRRAYQRE
jgi:hypothetical protein